MKPWPGRRHCRESGRDSPPATDVGWKASGPFNALEMLVANQDARTKFHYDSEQAGRWIGAARVVADVFHERFFATVGAYETRLDGYFRHWPTVLYSRTAGPVMPVVPGLVPCKRSRSHLLQVEVLLLLDCHTHGEDRPSSELPGRLVAFADSVAAVVADAKAVDGSRSGSRRSSRAAML